MTVNFKDFYKQDLQKKLLMDLGMKNLHQVPLIEKIVVNAGVRGAGQDSKQLNYVADGITAISGQKSVKRKARKSIASFKIREGVLIGASVTLRGASMYAFFEKLVRVVIPAIRDFRGVKTVFDKCGNYNLGIKDWSVFPEIDFDSYPNPHGLNISFHIKNGDNSGSSYALLKGFGFPFVENN